MFTRTHTTSSLSTMLLTLLMLISTAFAAKGSHNNETLIDGPLFDRYQYLSPGIMMGFLVGFGLLSILYVGISALSSLEVTYAAFEKESGPGTKKQQ